MKVFFQIGTNDGNDCFREKVIREKADCVVLVEPNPALIDKIKANYKNIPNVNIFQNAIYYESNTNVELFIPAKNGVYGTKADNGITYSDGHFSLVPMNDWGKKEDMVTIVATTITFSDICDKLNISCIDYLQIDTEGFDSEIIEMIDFNRFEVKSLRFEKWPFDPSQFSKYNEKICHGLGSSGMDASIHKLKSNGFIIAPISDRDGNDFIATKQ